MRSPGALVTHSMTCRANAPWPISAMLRSPSATSVAHTSPPIHRTIPSLPKSRVQSEPPIVHRLRMPRAGQFFLPPSIAAAAAVPAPRPDLAVLASTSDERAPSRVDELQLALF